MRLLLDENLSPLQASRLRELGHDAVAVSEVGLSGKSDYTVRGFAVEQNRVLLTLDADFADMLRFPPAGTPGVIRLRVHPPSEAIIWEQIQKALTLLGNSCLSGCLAVLHGDIVRIRS